MFPSTLGLYNLDMEISAHLKEGMSQGSSSISRTAIESGLLVKLGKKDIIGTSYPVNLQYQYS